VSHERKSGDWFFPELLVLSSCYTLEMKNILLNIFNILLNLFVLNDPITNILDLQLHAGIYAGYVAVTQPFLLLND
jgi:hypothetical protein